MPRIIIIKSDSVLAFSGYLFFGLSLLVLSVIFIAIDAFLIEPNWLKARTIRLSENPRLRIVHFTDIHHIKDSGLFAKAVEEINRLAPDFVCFTGDVTGGAEGSSDNFKDAINLFAKIKAPVYGVPGNHDYWAKLDFDAIDRALHSTGGKLLVNSKTNSMDGKAVIFGVATPNKYIPEPEVGKINILLCHYPSVIENLGEKKFDLILTGHTHGGQVRFPFYGAPILPCDSEKYDYGLFRTKNGSLYVGSGLGYFEVKARFNCRPEIVLFEL